VAQLLLAPLELGLPVQQPCLAEAPGQLGQLGADLGRKGGQLEPLGGHPRQHQVAQQRRQPLQQGSRFAAAIEQQAAAFGQGEGIGLGEGRRQLQQLQDLISQLQLLLKQLMIQALHLDWLHLQEKLAV
jgi:hypothetical protein